MPLPSPFPKYAFTTAYDALVDVLTHDPLLKRTVKTWKTWDGEAEDTAEPEPRQMPWVRLTPSLSPIKLATIHDYQVPFNVLIELASDTTDCRHLLDFWGAILDAMVDQKPHKDATVREYLRDHGDVVTYQFAQTATAPVVYRGTAMTGRAILTLMLHVNA